MLAARRILVTGATGQVGRPITEHLATNNEVVAAARFNDTAARAELEATGIATARFTLGDADLEHLPDVDIVVHCAADTTPNSAEQALAVNSDGTGFLMQRYRDASAFFHMSSSSVYARKDRSDAVYLEADVLGGSSPFAPHYAMSKLAAESVVRFQSRALGLPAIMARLNVAYGTHGHGGLPNVLHEFMAAGAPFGLVDSWRSWCTPIFEDDIASCVAGLIEHAEVGAPVVNLGGDEVVALDDMVREIAAQTGLDAKIEPSDDVVWECQVVDPTRRRELTGPCQVTWRDGLRRVLVAKGALEGS